MRIGNGVRALLVSGGVAIAATAAVAQDRPDLFDTWDNFTQTITNDEGNTEFNFGSQWISAQNGSAPSMSGFASQTVSTPLGNSYAYISAFLYEPNKIDRELGEQTLNQQNFADMFISGSTVGGVFDSGSNTTQSGCKVKTKFFDLDIDGDPDRFNGTITCNDVALGSLIVNPTIQQQVQDLLGTKDDGTGVKVKLRQLPD